MAVPAFGPDSGDASFGAGSHGGGDMPAGVPYPATLVEREPEDEGIGEDELEGGRFAGAGGRGKGEVEVGTVDGADLGRGFGGPAVDGEEEAKLRVVLVAAGDAEHFSPFLPGCAQGLHSFDEGSVGRSHLYSLGVGRLGWRGGDG